MYKDRALLRVLLHWLQLEQCFSKSEKGIEIDFSVKARATVWGRISGHVVLVVDRNTSGCQHVTLVCPLPDWGLCRLESKTSGAESCFVPINPWHSPLVFSSLAAPQLKYPPLYFYVSPHTLRSAVSLMIKATSSNMQRRKSERIKGTHTYTHTLQPVGFM